MRSDLRGGSNDIMCAVGCELLAAVAAAHLVESDQKNYKIVGTPWL